MVIRDFLIRANWGRVPDDKKILIDLTDRECSHVKIVLSWAKDNEDALWTKILLTPTNIDRSLVVPDRSHVRGHKLKVVTPSSKNRPLPYLPKLLKNVSSVLRARHPLLTLLKTLRALLMLLG